MAVDILHVGTAILSVGTGVAYVAPDDAPAEDVAPTDIVFSTSTVPYDAAEDAVLCTLSAPGATLPVTYTIIGGDDAALVYVDGNAIKRSGSGSMTLDDVLDIDVQADNGVGSPYVETWAPSVYDPGAPITMPIGLRNYGASEVPAGSIIQFGVPLDRAREINPASVTYALARDSDSMSIPVQVDLTSTTRIGGHLCYAVATAKLPYALAATTTSQCTLTATPGGTYSGGTETVSASDLEARDFNVTLTGDDVTALAIASFNDFVYRRKIKSGSVETGWEGWSRFKESGSAAGQWCIHWRAMGRADTSVDDWRIEATVYCASVDGNTAFPPGNRGRTGTFVLRSASTVLNDDVAFENVFVSGNTGFKMYRAGDSLLPAHGGTTLRPVHDRDYLVESKAILPWSWTRADEGFSSDLGSTADAYVPGSMAGLRVGWGGGGLDSTQGHMSGTSYNMLRSLSDDTAWRQGYDYGLKMLSAPVYPIDPATGYVRPKFGSFPGMGTASGTQVIFSTTYSAAGVELMTVDDGHAIDTAYAPGLLTGESQFVGASGGIAMWSRARAPLGWSCPKVAGRPRRIIPWMMGWNMMRYDTFPLRSSCNQFYLSDDSRADKAYIAAQMEQTELFVQDIYLDRLALETVGDGMAPDAIYSTAFSGVPGTGAYATGICQFNPRAGGRYSDVPWNVDYDVFVKGLVWQRDGEAWIKDVWENWFNNYQIGRALGPGACVAYSAEYKPIAAESTAAVVQNFADYWQRYGDESSATVNTRSTCPTSGSPAGYPARYQHACALLERLGWAGAHGKTYRDVVEAVGAVFGGSPSVTLTTEGGRWEIERVT